jgi:Flp pilus assembly protein TadG
MRSRSWRRAACRQERGSALVEFSWLAILLLVPLLYIVLSVFEVQRAAFGVSAASRAAGRAFSQAPSEAEARVRALAAADIALRDQGVEPADRSLGITCRPVPGACLSPGSVVTVHVVAAVPLPLVPDLLGEHRPSVRVEAEHAVPYGTYREDRP